MGKAESQGRTEKPTPKRKKEARKEGRIARSPELVSWASIFVAMTVIQSTVVNGGRFLTQELNQAGLLIAAPDQGKALRYLVSSIEGSIKVIAPLVLTFMVLALVADLAQVRPVLSTKALKPSFKRLNPISGLKRLFSMQSTFQAVKQLLKLLIIGTVAYFTLYHVIVSLSTGGPYSTGYIISTTAKTASSFIREVAAAGILIGAIDYIYQYRRIADGLKMTKHEIKQEMRQQDVAPEIRGKIRQKQRQMSRNRMMASIKDADVVIVNPVHIAMALKYNPAAGAPRVIAKGAGFIAERIRDLADENRVPLVQDIPLARALHRACEIDDEIPAALFEAVAKVLAFVYALRSRGTSAGFHKMPGTPDLEEADRMDLMRAVSGK